MLDCNAEVITSDVTDEVVARPLTPDWPNRVRLSDIPDGVTVQRKGDRLVQVLLHELRCNNGKAHHDENHRYWPEEDVFAVEWTDDAPGATSHREPTRSERHIQHAQNCWCLSDSATCCNPSCCSDLTVTDSDLTVTDAEIEAAMNARVEDQPRAANYITPIQMRAALLAAKRAEKEQKNG